VENPPTLKERKAKPLWGGYFEALNQKPNWHKNLGQNRKTAPGAVCSEAKTLQLPPGCAPRPFRVGTGPGGVVCGQRVKP